ncbi:flagellar assembly protein FliH [Bacillus sp. SCS-153A]|uniref:flagellar assembly protein FliH n=1 Tax=Rossellomorea sedimentorum TaxID=3115294 RepID=UPI003905A590
MSKVIKNTQTPSADHRQAKVISLRNISGQNSETSDSIPAENQQIKLERDKVLKDAQAEAEQMLESAKAEAAKMKEEVASLRASWDQEKEVLQQEAYQQAYLKGLAEGREQGIEEYRQYIDQAAQIISKAKNDYYQHVEKSENVILELGLRTAEKIIGRTLDEDSSTFLDIIKRGIKEVRELPEVQIHVHPANYNLLSDNQEELESMFPVLRKLLIYPDDDLGRDECFIETGEGRVIVSVESQLREIKTKLVEILEGEDA